MNGSAGRTYRFATLDQGPERYTAIYVYGNGAPESCDVTAVGREYWSN